MAILISKVVNLTYYNLKEGQFKVILTLKVVILTFKMVILTFKMVIFDLKVIKNGFGISAKFQISEFQISKIFRISDSAFQICLNISVSTPSLIRAVLERICRFPRLTIPCVLNSGNKITR